MADTPGQMAQVNADLGARGYPIKIGPGLLSQAATLIGAAAPRAKCAIVTDAKVAGLHLATLESSLRAAQLLAGPAIVLPAGEATKSFDQLALLCGRLLDLEIERGDLVIALGGGVIGDLAGFAAAILRRGVRLTQIPTTLLAQVDAAIGGKTGINTRHGKNLIGAFHQPLLVICDTGVLDTLDARQFRAGYAEVLKYGLIGDAPFYAWLEQHWRGVSGGDAAARLYAIEKSCRAKAAIVAEDEREAGRRALLNFGHTFAHALEVWAGYSGALLHGEAVAVGMALALQLSEKLQLCPEGASQRLIAHLREVGLPARITDIQISSSGRPSPRELIFHMRQDKKMREGRLTFVLARGIGEAFLSRDVDAQQLEHFLSEKCNGL